MSGTYKTLQGGTVSEHFPYNSVRTAQKDILSSLDKIYAFGNKYRYIVIEAGTGIGKSAIAKAISEKEGNCYLLTATKQLQDQYIKDFGNMGAKAVKGSVNYECSRDEGMPCSNGECKFTKGIYTQCTLAGECPYYNAKKEAEGSEMYVTSYAYFLRISRKFQPGGDYHGKFTKRNAIIVDECHMLEDQLLNCAGFSLSSKKMNDRYKMNHGLGFKELCLYNRKLKDGEDEKNIEWVHLVDSIIMRKMMVIDKQIQCVKTGNRATMTADELSELEDMDLMKLANKKEELLRLHEKIQGYFLSENKDNWIMSVKENTLSIKPIDVDGLFQKLINGWAERKVVFMSATILDKVGFCKDMGIIPNETAFITRDGTFSSANSPIVYDPIGSMNYKNIGTTMPYVIEEVKRIMDMHPNEKGIIHTSTYNIAKQLTEAIDSDRFVVREVGESNESLLKYHVASDKPTVLVSPSLMAGVDLHDDLSRFQIIVKLPYISLADERVKRKMNKNKKWYTCKMLRNLIQECGRSTRNDKDWSVTYILDNAFETTMRYNKNMLPKSFQNRIVNVNNFDVEEYESRMKNAR